MNNYIYVACWDDSGTPIASSNTWDGLIEHLNEYNDMPFTKYEAYNPKYPDSLDGWFYYDSKEGEDKFKVYCIEFKHIKK